jgi:oligo-alginate lyase
MEASIPWTEAGWPDNMTLRLISTRVALAAILAFSQKPGLALGADTVTSSTPPLKTRSVFFTDQHRRLAHDNVRDHNWAAEFRDLMTALAEPWMKYSDNELSDIMFGPAIPRSWMVYSDGKCPACKADVPMYTWIIDAFKHPWKVQCPHCKEFFPKNDFQAFYKSGLNQHEIFEPQRADRKLLFNAEHPDADDPLHTFGVDDGTGFVQGKDRWRFIGTYLIYGQWKQLIVGGVRNLAAAYVVTEDIKYAHKAGILLDRVADIYPTFDFSTQGFVYEKQGAAGYVSAWHDACQEIYDLTLAYDQIFDAISRDEPLHKFLAEKSAQRKLTNRKTTFTEIQRNIEERIFRDTLGNPAKIHSNFPRREVAQAVIKTTLDWPASREEVYAELEKVIQKSVAVDGTTGEKGLTGYACFTLHGLATMLQLYDTLDPDFLRQAMERNPPLKKTFRFHIDTWCFGQYYPLVGDCGEFAQRISHYVAIPFPDLRPKKSDASSGRKGNNPGDSVASAPSLVSMHGLFWKLYKLTNDESYAQVLHLANRKSTSGLPRDPFVRDPQEAQRTVAEIVQRRGTLPQSGSVNEQEWHLAILKSRRQKDPRAIWLHYDSGSKRNHAHFDGMNLGLFAKGLDLMPDFGYPPVQYGGWSSPRAAWYKRTVAHNTVAIEGNNHAIADGRTTLFADGETLQAVRATCPEMAGSRQFERTAALVNVSESDCYVVDVFRVEGGTSHTKFMQSHFGSVTPSGLDLKPAPEYGHGSIMRNMQSDKSPQTGWQVDWKVEDKHHYLPREKQVRVRYTDFTSGAEAMLGEGWVSVGGYNARGEAWIPRVMTHRTAAHAPLSSTFVSIIEPYETSAPIRSARRLPLTADDGKEFSDQNVALELTMRNGQKELFVAMDSENALGSEPSLKTSAAHVKESGLVTNAELCHLRLDADGKVNHIALCRATQLSFPSLVLKLRQPEELTEIALRGNQATIISGKPDNILEFSLDGKSVAR